MELPTQCLEDPITYEVFKDPVIADDNHTYERKAIEDWFLECDINGNPCTSPLTGAVITRGLRPNLVVRKILDDWVQEHGEFRGRLAQNGYARFPTPNLSDDISSVTALSSVFEAIDAVSEVLEELSWQPPQIVVLGNENTGKSTLLERIAMMPLFPTNRNICTRMIIKICLRRGEPTNPRLEVLDIETRRVERSLMIAMNTAASRINMVMQEEVRKENNGKVVGLCQRKMIVVHVQSTTAPNLDLVDLPGLVAAGGLDEPQNMKDLTRSLALTYLDTCTEHSIYLVTVSADSPANHSIAMNVIQERNLQQWTIGVWTKADRFHEDPEDPHAETFQDKLNQNGHGAVVLTPHGYVATMNKLPLGQHVSPYDQLTAQARTECEYFQTKGFDPYAPDSRVSSNALIRRLVQMYHAYVMITWLPATLNRLHQERAVCVERDILLGLPRAHDINDLDLETLRRAAEETIRGHLQRELGNHTETLFGICSVRDFATVVNHACPLTEFKNQLSLCKRLHLGELSTILSQCIAHTLGFVMGPLEEDRSVIRLDRFPALEQIKLNLEHMLRAWQLDTFDEIVEATDRLYHATWSPHVKISHRISAEHALVDFQIDYSDFHRSIIQTILEGLVTRLQTLHIADLIPTDLTLWVENCATERIEIISRLHQLELSEDRLCAILGIAADSEAKDTLLDFCVVEERYRQRRNEILTQAPEHMNGDIRLAILNQQHYTAMQKFGEKLGLPGNILPERTHPMN